MNRTFIKQRNRFDLLRFSRRILPAGLLAAFLVTTSMMMVFQVTANDEESGLTWQQLAQETNGYWQLVDTIIDPVPDERVTVERMGVPDEGKAYAEEIRSGVLCAIVTNSLSEGSFTKHKEWYQDKKCYTSSASYTFVATWGQPPGRITPGMPLSLEANVSKTLNVQPGFGSSFQMGITTDAPHTTCGYLTAGAKYVASFVVSTDDRSDKNPEAILVVGAGGSAGEQFALRYCVSGNFGYRYVYEWVADEEKPTEPDPGVVEDPGPEQSGPEQPEPDVESPEVSPPDSDYDWPSSSPSDYDSNGSLLGPIAIIGVLGGLGVIGVIGAAVVAILAGVLKGSAAAGGAATVAGAAKSGVPKRASSQNAPRGQRLPDNFIEGLQFGGPSDNPNINYDHQDDDCRPF